MLPYSRSSMLAVHSSHPDPAFACWACLISCLVSRREIDAFRCLVTLAGDLPPPRPSISRSRHNFTSLVKSNVGAFSWPAKKFTTVIRHDNRLLYGRVDQAPSLSLQSLHPGATLSFRFSFPSSSGWKPEWQPSMKGGTDMKAVVWQGDIRLEDVRNPDRTTHRCHRQDHGKRHLRHRSPHGTGNHGGMKRNHTRP